MAYLPPPDTTFKEVRKMSQFRPLRFIRRRVGFAFKSFSNRLGGAVRLAFPRRSRTKRRNLALTNEATWKSVVRESAFKDEICDDMDKRYCKSLVTVGSRQWGNWWDGRGLLKVKVYEFAIYADKNQLRKSRLSRSIRRKGASVLKQSGFYKQLRSADDVDMTLQVRASRDLPLKTVTGEYEKILKRRLERVGGKDTDTALPELISMLNENGSNSNNKFNQDNVKSGSILQFKKDKSGYLTAIADEKRVGTVHSPDLCAALFDLYLGEEPVSQKAKSLAGKRIVDFVLEGPSSPSYRKHESSNISDDSSITSKNSILKQKQLQNKYLNEYHRSEIILTNPDLSKYVNYSLYT